MGILGYLWYSVQSTVPTLEIAQGQWKSLVVVAEDALGGFILSRMKAGFPVTAVQPPGAGITERTTKAGSTDGARGLEMRPGL